MILTSLYDDLKTYLDPFLGLYVLVFDSAPTPTTCIVAIVTESDRSAESKMCRVKMNFTGQGSDYAAVHAAVEVARANLHRQRGFLSSFKASYAFAEGIYPVVPIKESVVAEGYIKTSGQVFPSFDATLLIEDLV